ncbi:MAG: hypothetical protein ACAH80_18575 [Alphaproteobacteria bacterium]
MIPKFNKLKQHKFYVYHDGAKIFARMDDLDPVLVEECKGGGLDDEGQPKSPAQEAHDKVMTILNPKGLKHTRFGPRGFLEDSFQKDISKHCEATVTAAYAKGK